MMLFISALSHIDDFMFRFSSFLSFKALFGNIISETGVTFKLK